MVEKEDNIPEKTVEERLQTAEVQFLQGLQETELVSGVVMAHQNDTLHVAVIYRQDISSEEELEIYDPYGDISFISSDFQIKTIDILPLRVSAINPSQVKDLSEKWEKEGIDKDTIRGIVFPSQKPEQKTTD